MHYFFPLVEWQNVSMEFLDDPISWNYAKSLKTN